MGTLSSLQRRHCEAGLLKALETADFLERFRPELAAAIRVACEEIETATLSDQHRVS